MKKKYLFIVIIAFFVTSFQAQTTSVSNETIDGAAIVLDWQKSFKKALQKSKKQKKPILIYFTGSDWCGPCRVLDEKLFHTPKFKQLADQELILYEADYPRKTDLLSPEKLKVNKALKAKYKVKSFPTLVMVNHKGKKIDVKKGLILTEYYYPFFQSVIDRY